MGLRKGIFFLDLHSELVTTRRLHTTPDTATQSCTVHISIHTYSHEHNNITVGSDIYNTQLHVSTLYVGHHQAAQRTY